MERTTTEPSVETWMSRVTAESMRRREQAPQSDQRTTPAAVDATQGWDPYEVWLHRIRRPQLRRERTGW